MPATIAPEFIPSACDVEVCLHDRRPRWRERTVRGGFAVAALIAVLIAIASILSSSPNTQHTAKSSSLGEKYMLEDIPCRADCGDEGAQNGQEHAVVKVNDLRSTSRTLSQGNMEQQKDVKDRSEHISLQQKEEEAAEVAWYQRHLPSLAMDGANNYDMDCFYHHEVEWCMKLHAKQKAAGSVGDIMRAAMKKKLSKNKEVLRGSDQATQRVISARASGKVTHPTSNAKHSTAMMAGELARNRDSLAASSSSSSSSSLASDDIITENERARKEAEVKTENASAVERIESRQSELPTSLPPLKVDYFHGFLQTKKYITVGYNDNASLDF
jgi:hypothetical protein